MSYKTDILKIKEIKSVTVVENTDIPGNISSIELLSLLTNIALNQDYKITQLEQEIKKLQDKVLFIMGQI